MNCEKNVFSCKPVSWNVQVVKVLLQLLLFCPVLFVLPFHAMQQITR
jgi:hypothetical protein